MAYAIVGGVITEVESGHRCIEHAAMHLAIDLIEADEAAILRTLGAQRLRRARTALKQQLNFAGRLPSREAVAEWQAAQLAARRWVAGFATPTPAEAMAADFWELVTGGGHE